MGGTKGVDVGVIGEPAELVAPGTEGAVECAAAGCSNWFVKRSGRHRFCKSAGCTYRRGAPPELELALPVGAAAELLLRLQDPEGGGEVGPEVVGPRLRRVTEAQRAGDDRALYGALLDAAVGLVAWAARVKDGTMPKARQLPPGAPSRPVPAQVGLVSAVIASHRRTLALGDARVDAIWQMMAAREKAKNAEAGVQATIGTEASAAAQENAILLRERARAAERALQSVEAAWAERQHVAAELEAAGGPANGGANGRPRAA